MIILRNRKFHTLDGLRGVAAILITFRHTGVLAGELNFPESFLAVDLFFLLSGFVISHSYENRIANGNFFCKFIIIRIIRLYPLLFLGLFSSFLLHIYLMSLGLEDQHFYRTLASLAVGLLFIPPIPPFYVSGGYLDGPTWTLLPELAINTLYAFYFKYLSNMIIIIIVIVGFLCLFLCVSFYGTLDRGWSFETLPVAFSRVSFSFFVGVLLFRCIGDQRRKGTLLSCFLVLIIIPALCFSPPEHWRPVYELFLVSFGFPIVLYLACLFEPEILIGYVFRFLGLTSYSVYILHEPLAMLVNKCIFYNNDFRKRVDTVGIFVPLIFTLVVLITAWIADRFYDNPIRNELTRRRRAVQEQHDT